MNDPGFLDELAAELALDPSLSETGGGLAASASSIPLPVSLDERHAQWAQACAVATTEPRSERVAQLRALLTHYNRDDKAEIMDTLAANGYVVNHRTMPFLLRVADFYGLMLPAAHPNAVEYLMGSRQRDLLETDSPESRQFSNEAERLIGVTADDVRLQTLGEPPAYTEAAFADF